MRGEEPGILREKQGQLFGRFQKRHTAHHGAGGGIGLGPASSKDIVEQHGGTIAVESELGRGRVIYVDLPSA